MLTLNNAQMVAALTQLLAVGGPLHGVKCALFSAGTVPGPGSVLSSYTLAAFTGSTPVTVTFGSPYVDAADGYAYADAFITFNNTGTTAETELGYLLTDTAGAVLVAGDLFPAPITINGPGGVIEFVLRVRQTRIPGGQAIVVP
jgi:hypothetical protein